MLQRNVYAESMSCLLCRNVNYEICPEPFRMQRNVIFRLPFSEYTRYLLTLNKDTQITLMHDIEELIRMAVTSQPILYNFFLKDVAFAIMKEIVFSERYRRKCTILLPISDGDDKDVNISQLLEIFPNCYNAQYELLKCVRNSGFELSDKISSDNYQMFKLAVVLYHLSCLDRSLSEMTLIYDLGN